MNKKILLFIALFTFVFFFNALTASAAQVYVGVQLSHATAPGYAATGSTPTNNNWCLPGGTGSEAQIGGTQMAITKDSDCSLANNIGASSMCYYCGTAPNFSDYCVPPIGSAHYYDAVVYTTAPTCAGNTIWSGLLDLTTSSNYRAYLYVPNFCSGYYTSNGYTGVCMEAAGANKSCADICAHYGQTSVIAPYTGGQCTDVATNCDAIVAVKGSACSTCTPVSTYSYYSPTTNDCWYSNSYYSDCSGNLGSDLVRVCACNFSGAGGHISGGTSFSFPFTANF